ncbi:energy-coupling factor transporter transmembrane protein EcfT, partial [Jiangella anatolica]
MTMLTGAYVPGTSVVHRVPAGWKLALLAAGCTALLFARSLPWVGVALVVVVGLYA